MPVPVQTQILDLIDARLRNISVLNEYFNDLEKLERARLTPFMNDQMPAINYYSTGDVLVQNLNTGIRERAMTVVIEFYDTTRDRVFLDVSNELESDVDIAIDRDPLFPKVSDPDSSRLGKNVMKLELSSSTPAIGEGQSPYCGVVLVYSITYRVSRQDPFTLIT